MSRSIIGIGVKSIGRKLIHVNILKININAIKSTITTNKWKIKPTVIII